MMMIIYLLKFSVNSSENSLFYKTPSQVEKDLFRMKKYPSRDAHHQILII